jgi:hypothetical protein
MTEGRGAVGENAIREYEKRAKVIEEKSARYYDLAANLAEMESKITEIRERWEPELDELVGKISAAFAENFAKIQCVGEVAVHKDDDFEQWAIQIRVKFRYAIPILTYDLSDLSLTVAKQTNRISLHPRRTPAVRRRACCQHHLLSHVFAIPSPRTVSCRRRNQPGYGPSQ